jgi:hypothetical protein
VYGSRAQLRQLCHMLGLPACALLGVLVPRVTCKTIFWVPECNVSEVAVRMETVPMQLEASPEVVLQPRLHVIEVVQQYLVPSATVGCSIHV